MCKKCEWVKSQTELRFFPCKGFDPADTGGGVITCFSCKEDIERPKEPEVVIKKSGGTLVANFHETDYFCHDKNNHESLVNTLEDGETEAGIIVSRPDIWEQITDGNGNQAITITDEIARLRPRVWVYMDSETDTLYGCRDTESLLWNTGRMFTKHIRLATVSDLE